MFGSPILDVAIGMAFIFLLLSLIASALQEILASFLQSRAASLQRGLRSLFSNDKFNSPTPLLTLIYDHGLVRGLYQDPEKDWMSNTNANKFLHTIWKALAWVRGALRYVFGVAPPGIPFRPNDILLPAYIPSRTFALALIDILNNPKPNGWDSLKNIEDNLSQIHTQFAANKAVEALLALVKDAGGKPDKLQANLENWYNDSMDRVSGWYKRYVQKILILIGFALAVGFNVDSIKMAQVLWTDKDSRDAIVTAAGDYLKNHPDPPVSVPNSRQNRAGEPIGGSSNGSVNSAPALSGAANTNHVKAKKATTATSTEEARGEAGAGANAVGKSAAARNDISQNNDQAKYNEKPKPLIEKDLQDRLKSTVNAFNQVNKGGLLPIGWPKSPLASLQRFYDTSPKDRDWGRLGRMLAGWLITAIALSLGAPFWFDTLNKFMVVRGTVKPQEKSQPEKSKDG
jgi:hypothetical protein